MEVDLMQVNYLSSVNFNGCSTSQFYNQKKMLDDDLLICTVDGESKNIEYKTLRDQIFNDIHNTILSVKSMAYRDKTSYALSSHNHGYLYNKLEITKDQDVGNIELFRLENSYAAKSKQINNISATQIYSEKPKEPKPGTVKFVYGNKKVKSFPVDNQFDGWVYADGSKTEYTLSDLNLSKEQFVKLPSYQVMGNNDSSNPKIIVPTLSSFFKVSKSGVTSITQKEYQIGLPNHLHELDDNFRINMKIKSSSDTFLKTYPREKDSSKLPHEGHGNVVTSISAKYTVDISSINIPEFKSDPKGEDKEPKPPHCKLLVMVYIGGRTKPYTI